MLTRHNEHNKLVILKAPVGRRVYREEALLVHLWWFLGRCTGLLRPQSAKDGDCIYGGRQVLGGGNLTEMLGARVVSVGSKHNTHVKTAAC